MKFFMRTFSLALTLALLIGISPLTLAEEDSGIMPTNSDPLWGADLWARDELQIGIDYGLIPKELQKDYKGTVSRIQIAQLSVNLLELALRLDISLILARHKKEIDRNAFTDTEDENILAVSALGIINGTGGGKFSPDAPVTRAQFAAIISRTAGVLGYNLSGYPEPTFEDVQSHWVKNELSFSVEVGIFNGTGMNQFSPDRALTVQELGAASVRALTFYRSNLYNPDVPPEPSKNVTVSTAAELIEAIAPDTCITLQSGKYDVSTQAGTAGKFINWRKDDYRLGELGFSIQNITGLTLQAAPSADVEIVTPYRYVEVIEFLQCNGITLKDIRFGHSVTGEYECDASVVLFSMTSNITVSGCNFYGCGAVGLYMGACQSADIRDTVVNDCTLHGVVIRDGVDIAFTDCKFIDNSAYMSIIDIREAAEAVSFTNCEISGNKGIKSEGIVNADGGDVLFDNCVFKDNALDSEAGDGYPLMAGGVIRLKDCAIEKGNFTGYFGDGYRVAQKIEDLGGNKFT
jgi:hypothetical protein